LEKFSTFAAKYNMDKWIKNITGIIPHTNKNVSIELEGRSLIVTGANGFGKTSFLQAVYEKVDLLIAKKKGADLSQIEHDLMSWQDRLNNSQKWTTNYDTAVRQIKHFESQLKAIISFFEEKRLSEIMRPSAAKLSRKRKKMQKGRIFRREMQINLNKMYYICT
jgi:AAA15 family ATPase/GTPase